MNLVDLARPFILRRSGEAATDPRRTAVKLFIERLGVRSGRIDFEDRARATFFARASRPSRSSCATSAPTGEAGNAYALRAASVDDERFAWNGTFALTPFTSRGQFEVANLRATTLWSYLRDALPFEFTSGMINLQGEYEFAARETGLKLNVKDVTATDCRCTVPISPRTT